MYIKWTEHIQDPDEKLKFERFIKSSKPILEHLILLLKNKKDSLERQELDAKMFDNPNWDYKQAFLNGKKAEISELIKLIDLDQQKG